MLSPRSRLRFAYRQHGVIEVATAPRLCVGWHRIRPTPSRGGVVGQVVVIRVLCGRYFWGWRCIRGLRYRSPTAKSRRHPASGVTSFGRPFQRRHYRARCGGFITDVDAMTCEACEAETQARHIARGKRSATPGCHHPPPTLRPHRTRIRYHPRNDRGNRPQPQIRAYSKRHYIYANLI